MIDPLGNFHITVHGYPRFHSGRYAGKYVHRVYAARYRKRRLTDDQTVHHRNANKLDWTRSNLLILGWRQHGWVSAKQHFYMKHIRGAEDRKSWDEYFEEEQAAAGFPFGMLDPSIFKPSHAGASL